MHNRQSNRLEGYDYSKAGWYYVTICTYEHQCLFGHIENDQMVLNDRGRIVEEEWLKAQTIRNNITLDEFIIMPNHIHGIIILHDEEELAPPLADDDGFVGLSDNVGATRWVAQRPTGPARKSLGAIIGQFKSKTTKEMKKQGLLTKHAVWQRDFYDHIIRNLTALHHIREYIQQNPVNWATDKYNPGN